MPLVHVTAAWVNQAWLAELQQQVISLLGATGWLYMQILILEVSRGSNLHLKAVNLIPAWHPLGVKCKCRLERQPAKITADQASAYMQE